jgi:hypothetical protein
MRPAQQGDAPGHSTFAAVWHEQQPVAQLHFAEHSVQHLVHLNASFNKCKLLEVAYPT